MAVPFPRRGWPTLLAVMTAAAACNSVLGIDPAELDPALAGAAGSGGQGSTALPQTYRPVAACNQPSSACTTCLETCTSGALSACLTNSQCRDALDRHRVCLGDDCQSGNPSAWAACAEESDLDTSLVLCAIGDCSATCTGTPLTGMCEQLCACKQQNCPGIYLSTCVADCQALGADGPELAYCRFKHCQVAVPEWATLHCPHADGVGQCVAATTAGARCPDRVHTGFPCADDDDCCSGACLSQVCE